MKLLIAAACIAIGYSHIHENYVQATDHGFYGESHGTNIHVAEDMPHFGDGFGNLAQQHIHMAPKEGTKARECEDRMWNFAESDNLSYQQIENIRELTPDMSRVPHMYRTEAEGLESVDRWDFEDSLWRYKAPMFPKLCTDPCTDQEEIKCLVDQCFIRTNFCCSTQCVPKDMNKRLAYMFTNNMPTASDGKVTYSEINAVVNTLATTMMSYPAGSVGGNSLSWRGFGNTDREVEYTTLVDNSPNAGDSDDSELMTTVERSSMKLLEETRQAAIHCVQDDTGNDLECTAAGERKPWCAINHQQDQVGVTPRYFAKCIHDLAKEKKEERMSKCKWDTPVIKRKQPYGTKYTFRKREEATYTKISQMMAARAGLVDDVEMAQRAFLNCEAGDLVNRVHATLPMFGAMETRMSQNEFENDDVDSLGRETDGSEDDEIMDSRPLSITSWRRRTLSASLRRRMRSEKCGGTGGVNAPELEEQADGSFRSTGRLSEYCCSDEEAVIAALADAIETLDAQIKAVEVSDPDITLVRVECPVCFMATGCPSTPPGYIEIDNPGKNKWCSSFTQYSRCLFYPDQLAPADDEKSLDDLERRLEIQSRSGMWLWERDANMYDNLDKCEIIPRTDNALHTCRCANGYASKFGGNPGIGNECIAVPHDHHHHGHHGEHGNEPVPEVESPAFSRPGYTLDREYDIVTYQNEHAVPLDDMEHDEEYWGYEEGHGLVNYGHLRPSRGYADDSENHVADDNPDYKDQDDAKYDNTGYRYGDEGDFFHAPYGVDNDGEDDGMWLNNRGSAMGGWGNGWGQGGYSSENDDPLMGMNNNDNDNNNGMFGSIFDGFPMFQGARKNGMGGNCLTIIGMAFMAMGVFLLSFYA